MKELKALGILRAMNRNDKQANEVIAELEADNKALARDFTHSKYVDKYVNGYWRTDERD